MLNLFDTAPVFTWAAKPLASAMPGKVIRISNVGPATVGSFWISDGTRWTALNGRVTLARGATPVSVTGTTNETTFATVTAPGAAMGLNGQLEITTMWSYTNSANAKTPRVRFDGTSFTGVPLSTTSAFQHMTIIRNRNSASSQVGFVTGSSAFAAASGSMATASIDTTIDKNITITGQLASSGETLTLESYSVELIT